MRRRRLIRPRGWNHRTPPTSRRQDHHDAAGATRGQGRRSRHRRSTGRTDPHRGRRTTLGSARRWSDRAPRRPTGRTQQASRAAHAAVTASPPPRLTPASRCGMCRKRSATLIRERRCAMTVAASPVRQATGMVPSCVPGASLRPPCSSRRRASICALAVHALRCAVSDPGALTAHRADQQLKKVSNPGPPLQRSTLGPPSR